MYVGIANRDSSERSVLGGNGGRLHLDELMAARGAFHIKVAVSKFGLPKWQSRPTISGSAVGFKRYYARKSVYSVCDLRSYLRISGEKLQEYLACIKLYQLLLF